MARESIQLIDRLLKGEKCDKCICVPAQVIYRESCCKQHNTQEDSFIEARYNQRLVSFNKNRINTCISPSIWMAVQIMMKCVILFKIIYSY